MVLYNIYSFSPRRDFVLLVFALLSTLVCEFSLTILNVGKGNGWNKHKSRPHKLIIFLVPLSTCL